jgi:hypothetical protein
LPLGGGLCPNLELDRGLLELLVGRTGLDPGDVFRNVCDLRNANSPGRLGDTGGKGDRDRLCGRARTVVKVDRMTDIGLLASTRRSIPGVLENSLVELVRHGRAAVSQVPIVSLPGGPGTEEEVHVPGPLLRGTGWRLLVVACIAVLSQKVEHTFYHGYARILVVDLAVEDDGLACAGAVA